MSAPAPDDSPQWYWAAASGLSEDGNTNAGDRFVVARGESVLWARVRQEIDPRERCAWMPFGSGGKSEPTLDECFRVLMNGREVHGANLNKVVVELAQVRAFAEWVAVGEGAYIHQTVSNPRQGAGRPLDRPGYSRHAAEALGRVVGETLGLSGRWWE